MGVKECGNKPDKEETCEEEQEDNKPPVTRSCKEAAQIVVDYR